MGRKPCCDKVGLKRGPWTIEEDRKLMNFVLSNGIHCWRTVPKLAGLLRCGKSCRLRWINYLRPDLKRGGFTEAEEDQIIQLHATLGNRWSKIASHFVGRTDNEIKNHWNTRIKKRLRQMGIDPVSHKSVEPIPITKESSASENEAKEPDINDDLLSNYEIFNGRLEVIEHWLNEDNITLDGHQSSSASLQAESSLNASMSDFSPELFEKQCSNSTIIQDDVTYLNQWIDDEMDSFFRFSYHPDDHLPQVLL